jgi:hypothetical protein
VSRHEDPMLNAWWADHRGRLALEYPIAPGFGATRRRLDGIVRYDRPDACLPGSRAGDFGDPKGSDVLILQAKAHRLSFPLLGQAFFSTKLASRYLGVRSARAIALCTVDDADVRPLAEAHGVEVVEMPWAGPTDPFPFPCDRGVIQRAAAHLGGWLVFDVPLTRPRKPAAADQRAHAAVFLDGPWKHGDGLDDRDFVLVSQPGPRLNGHGYGLGMYVLGQAYFSAELVRRVARPKRLRTAVAVVKDDAAIHQLARELGVEVWVSPQS